MKKLAFVLLSFSFLLGTVNVDAQTQVGCTQELQALDFEVTTNEGDCSFTVSAVGESDPCFTPNLVLVPRNAAAAAGFSQLTYDYTSNGVTVGNASGCYFVILFMEVDCGPCEGYNWPVGHTTICICQ